MTVDDVKAVLGEIAAHADDDEDAHATEDQMYRDVLAAIAEGCGNAQELAATALQAKNIEFSRWCA